MFLNALNSMLALFGCMLIGFFCVRKKIFDDDANVVLNKLMLNIAVPAMFISAMNVEMSPELIREGSITLIAGFVYHLICVALAFFTMKIFKIKSELKPIWLFGLTFANIAFLGFPVVKDIFGEQMLFHATLFNISFNILVFSVGIIIISYGSNEIITTKKILLQPAFIGSVLGITLFLLPVQLPIFIDKILTMFGDVTPPLSMFVVGATLAATSILETFKNKFMYLFSFVKLVIIPAITYMVSNVLINDSEIVLLITVLSATPSAVLTVILAKRYNRDSELASQIVFVSTTLSVVTIPMILIIDFLI
ncbi:MAG: AEC family transporter [Bacilli bacterium]